MTLADGTLSSVARLFDLELQAGLSQESTAMKIVTALLVVAAVWTAFGLLAPRGWRHVGKAS